LPGGPGYGDAPWGNQRGGTFDPSRLPTAIRGVFSAIAAIANKYFAAAWLLGEAWRVIGEYNAAVAMDEAEKAAAAKEKLRDLERKAREIERQEKQRIRDEMRESRADARNRERIAAEDRRESARAAREAERERRELAKAERAAFEETLKIEFPKIEKRVYKPPPPPVKTRPWYIQNFPLLVQGLEFAKQRRSTQLGITNILPGQQFAPPQPAVTPTVLTAFGSGGVPSSPSQGTQVCYIRKPRPKRRRAKKTRRICYERAI
jgi:Skp family chaperone for outer membrane proteins